MSEEYDGYRQMVGELSESGFSPSQSEGLVKMFARTFERVRAENKAEHERTRGELREELNRYREEDKEERERIRLEDKDERERIRREDREERENLRREDREERLNFRKEIREELQSFRQEDREDRTWLQNRLDGVIAAQTRWMIATLCTIILTGIGALVAYVLTNVRTIGLS